MAVAAVTMAMGAAASAAPSDTASVVANLEPGESAFWSAPWVESARGSADDCATSGACSSFGVEVRSAHAWRLRVALDQADASNDYLLQLRDPSGALVSSAPTTTEYGLSHHYDVELFAAEPTAGLWTVEVVPQSVVHGAPRLRAKLERQPATPKDRHRLEPNMRADPPWDLGFVAPLPQIASFHVSSFAELLLGLHGVDSSLFGQPFASCLPEETVEHDAQRCLRFSSGVANSGAGAFHVIGKTPLASPGGLVQGPLTQRVYRSDGSYADHPAGNYVFHHVHLHYHVADLATFSLFLVGAEHRLEPAGTGLKEGFCLANSKMTTFRRFVQDDPASFAAADCVPSVDASSDFQFAEAVVPGWEDVYDWETSGQYVDFGDNPNGRYLLRMTVNGGKSFIESDPSDDLAYTYFQVTGNQVRPLERGRGRGPWDPDKVVLDPVLSR
jgi:hypothetical protein